ncbi:phage tail assembly chaperone [Comamonas kerstersii]|uniref:phage tail assembly chaperone n=1 Tax=Comamonas kerstersii TaxID=225992 RepID=UPI0026DD46D5|nr:phage tail assembly chaperone [Comamonas kerstersii]
MTQEKIARTVRLGQKPEGIPDVVKFKGLDGAEYMIPVTFKYRTLTEFGAFLDEVFSQPLPVADAADGLLSSKTVQQSKVNTNGQYLFQILKDWGLDVPLTLQACIQLADEMPAAAQALMGRYRELITEGRAGN